MADVFQRLLVPSEPQVFSMNTQAALGPIRAPRRSQFSWLLRLFVERFFNHETASPYGEAKTRFVQIACAAGLPPLVIAVYLWPIYHPIKGWPPGQPDTGNLPTYWLQVNHHLFFILYSFIALGIATVFEWDLFFPDLLDIFVLGPLPVPAIRSFLARICAIAIFTGGLLFDVNLLAAFVLPMSMDPPNLVRFLAAQVSATFLAGLFSAVFILALQSALLSVLGEHIFRKLALVLQSAAITFLVMLMLLFPVLSGVVPTLLQTQSIFVRVLPPFWFLGIYQSIFEGPAALPIYGALARTGIVATLAAVAVLIATYPLAYTRRIRQIIEGGAAKPRLHQAFTPLSALLNKAILRRPATRAVFHFISQTILRVPRYRIYLVLYGGVGLAVVTATVLRLSVVQHRIHASVSADGIRVALGIVIFWMVAGLRMAFVSSGNQRGRWIFRLIQGHPPLLDTALSFFNAARLWALIAVAAVTGAAWFLFRAIGPAQLLGWPTTAAQALIAAASCLILTDAFFLNVTTIAFTGGSTHAESNLAFTVLKYFAFFPLVTALPLRLEPLMEQGIPGFVGVTCILAGIDLYLRHRHRLVVQDFCSQLALEDDEEDFPMKLGLRY